jgi:hypothetical protein
MVQNAVILTTQFNTMELYITEPTHKFRVFLETAMTSLSSYNRLISLMEIEAAICVPRTALSPTMRINFVVQETALKVHVMFPQACLPSEGK